MVGPWLERLRLDDEYHVDACVLCAAGKSGADRLPSLERPVRDLQGLPCVEAVER